MSSKMHNEKYENLLNSEQKRKETNVAKWETLKTYIYNFRNSHFLERDWESWSEYKLGCTLYIIFHKLSFLTGNYTMKKF